jgi:simple sugar transport system substrate-binding protein
VTWIGFWFNIPGVTLDPTKVVNDFFTAGSDVVISGIDTPEAIVEAGKAQAAGKAVFAIPYDFKDACAKGEAACLGVPYFNWVPAYTKLINDVKAKTWKSEFTMFRPRLDGHQCRRQERYRFRKGKALTADNATKLDAFIAELAGGLNLWTARSTSKMVRRISRRVKSLLTSKYGICPNCSKVCKRPKRKQVTMILMTRLRILGAWYFHITKE